MGLELALTADRPTEVNVEKPHLQPPVCTLCELVFIMRDTLMRIICVVDELSATDLEAYFAVARQILAVARQQPQLELRTTVEQMRKLRDGLPHRPFPGRQTAARGLGTCKLQRTRGPSRCTWEQTQWWGARCLKAGSKRGLSLETEMFQQFVDECCGLSVFQGSSKRIKFLARPVSNEGDGGRSCPKEKPTYICRDTPVPSPDDELLACKSVSSGILSTILDRLRTLLPRRCPLRWFSKGEGTEPVPPTELIDDPVEEPLGWNSLPNELQENILRRVEFKDLFRFKILSRSCKKYIESDAFREWRADASCPEGLFTAINYYVQNKAWRCSGFDLRSRRWRSLPPFSTVLPAPDAELFKEYSVSGHGGLMCADVAKLPEKGQLVVFNPLTRETFKLPPLLNPRSPVLVHISVDSKTKSYKVIVAGSSSASDEHLSKKMEVFDSEKSTWEETVDLPGPAFGLNEHQAGVCLDGVLYFIAFLEGDCHRSVVAFDVERKKWLDDKTCPIPFSIDSNTLQLVETNGKVYLFSEQERGVSVEHCIDVLEISNLKANGVKWKNVVRVKKSGGRGLQVYPEHTCVSFGDEKLCVFNTLTRDGVVYDMRDGKQVEVLEPPPSDQKGNNFFALNPASFTVQPCFIINPVPRSVVVDPI